MIIAFTGHRDKLAVPFDLMTVYNEHPGAKWIHGGAVGFDAQVAGRKHGGTYQTVKYAEGRGTQIVYLRVQQ